MSTPNYPASQYNHHTLHNIAPQAPPQPPHPLPPSMQPYQQVNASEETLEQRLYDLLIPFRDDYATGPSSSAFDLSERKVLILCENIAFLIRHNQTSYGKVIRANDISIISRDWQGLKNGVGQAGIGVFVNGNGYTHSLVRATVKPGEGMLDMLAAQVDGRLVDFFPGV